MSGFLLEGKDLTKEFPAGRNKTVHAVSNVTLGLKEGETLGLVGESGCGKSTLGRMMIGALKPTSGQVLFRGQMLTGMSDREFAAVRRCFQMIFQDPYASLNPRMTVRDLIAEPLVTHHICSGKKETTEKVLELMDAVGVPGDFLYRYPHQFSGGQRQRIGIARAIAQSPEVIVCDEPVSALDVSVQNQILNLLSELRRTRRLTYLFISHDLSVVRHISDRVCVMFLGKVCESGPTGEIWSSPAHPYTSFLLRAVPKADPKARTDASSLLTGEIPSPIDPPAGCRFHTRCPYAGKICAEEEPPLQTQDERTVACHFPLDRKGT
ncbi:MAG: ATP-binding cassette domain-containing protein [Clostridia bacterium]|nr:ATP-binding cassette domain-containing protein [Clostridia bacterium]